MRYASENEGGSQTAPAVGNGEFYHSDKTRRPANRDNNKDPVVQLNRATNLQAGLSWERDLECTLLQGRRDQIQSW